MIIEVGDWVKYQRDGYVIIEEVLKVTTHYHWGTDELMVTTPLMQRLYQKDILEVRKPTTAPDAEVEK